MRDKTEEQKVLELAEAFLSLETTDECIAFFEDLFSPNETRSFCQRLEVAKLLKAGETFTEIEKKTGASSATTARISRCLSKGSGYKTVLGRIL